MICFSNISYSLSLPCGVHRWVLFINICNIINLFALYTLVSWSVLTMLSLSLTWLPPVFCCFCECICGYVLCIWSFSWWSTLLHIWFYISPYYSMQLSRIIVFIAFSCFFPVNGLSTVLMLSLLSLLPVQTDTQIGINIIYKHNW